MAGRGIYLTEDEAEAIYNAIDFISTNTDGVTDTEGREYFDQQMQELDSVYKKYSNAITRRAR